MDIKKSCEEGKMVIEDLFSLMTTPLIYRTHCLSEGDYVVVPLPTELQEKKDYVPVERVSNLNFPERGDFETERGTIGPISGNIFIKLQGRGKFPPIMVIEGDNITGEHEVYALLNKYVQARVEAGQGN